LDAGRLPRPLRLSRSPALVFCSRFAQPI
jgi:hypothetical protein